MKIIFFFLLLIILLTRWKKKVPSNEYSISVYPHKCASLKPQKACTHFSPILFLLSLFLHLIPGRGRRSGSVVSKSFCRLHLLAPLAVPACPGPQDRAISLWVCLLVAFRGSPCPSLVWGCFLVPYGAHAQTIWACSPLLCFLYSLPQLFSDIFTLHFVFHCHPFDSSQHSHFCLL